MRTLNEIVGALRSGDDVTRDELAAAVVAFDVLLAQLDLPADPVRMQAYFRAAESDPVEYAGPLNALDDQATQEWFRAMARAGQPEPHEWDDDGERCVKCGDKDWFAGPACVTGNAKL